MYVGGKREVKGRGNCGGKEYGGSWKEGGKMKERRSRTVKAGGSWKKNGGRKGR